MAGTLGINGIASGFNTDEIIKAIMEKERLPLTSMETKKQNLQARSDAWRELNSRIYKLKDAAYNLQSFTTFRAQKVTVSDDKVLSATASAEALLSSYQLNVKSLAKAHSVSTGLINDATSISGGKIQITINGDSKEIGIAPEGSTNQEKLNSIAKQINAAGAGVTASVINLSENEYKLYLTGKETGVPNQLVLEDVGTDRVLRDLGVLDETGLITHEAQAATDAVIEINGDTTNPAARSSNTITDLIPGVALTLKETGALTLGVELDKEKVVETVKGFVDAYNSVMDYINQNKTFSYNETTKTGTAGKLFGDSSLMYIESQIKNTLYQKVDGVDSSVGLLSLVGIKGASGVEGAKSGKLEFDEELFKTKLDSNFDDISKLFGASSEVSDGIFTQLHDDLFEWTSTDGVLKNKSNTIQREISDIDDRMSAMEDRLELREKYYYSKFMAMEKALATMQSQSSWLSAQLGTLSSQWKK
jgi:flagellar hook-associated protein 2